MNDPYENQADPGIEEEVTFEVTVPKKRGRPKKVEVVMEDASPPEAPVPVKVVVTEPPVPLVKLVQSVPAQTLAEMQRGSEAVNKWRR